MAIFDEKLNCWKVVDSEGRVKYLDPNLSDEERDDEIIEWLRN